MKKGAAGGYCYPNKIGRILLLGLQDVLAREGVMTVLEQAGLGRFVNNYPENNLKLKFSFEALASILNATEVTYGPQAGRGLALRAGRACFKYGLREFGPELGVTEPPFRLLPLGKKLLLGAQAFAEVFNRHHERQVRIEAGPDGLLLHVEPCPLCWGRRADSPVCHLAVGLLGEALYWVSGGKHFAVEEVACAAQGAPGCDFLIGRQPLY